LPGTIVADCYANPTITDLSEDGTLPGLAQAAAGGWREVVHFTPEGEGHNPIVIERPLTRALAAATNLFEQSHDGSSTIQEPSDLYEKNPVNKSGLIFGTSLPCRRELILQRLDPLLQAAIGWRVPLHFSRHDKFERLAITLEMMFFPGFLDNR
jgi:hypothetical protein